MYPSVFLNHFGIKWMQPKSMTTCNILPTSKDRTLQARIGPARIRPAGKSPAGLLAICYFWFSYRMLFKANIVNLCNFGC